MAVDVIDGLVLGVAIAAAGSALLSARVAQRYARIAQMLVLRTESTARRVIEGDDPSQ